VIECASLSCFFRARCIKWAFNLKDIFVSMKTLQHIFISYGTGLFYPKIVLGKFNFGLCEFTVSFSEFFFIVTIGFSRNILLRVGSSVWIWEREWNIKTS